MLPWISYGREYRQWPVFCLGKQETFLKYWKNFARAGGKKGDLSPFVDDAVRRRLLDFTVRQVKDRNARYGQEEILDLIDEEVAAARAGRS